MSFFLRFKDRKNKRLVNSAEEGEVETVKILLKKGADANFYQLGSGRYALNCAVVRGHTNIVELLLSAGAKVSENDLRDASKKGHTDIVELLLSVEAYTQPEYKDSWVERALRSAAMNGHTDTVELLVSAGAEVTSETIWNAIFKDHKDIVKLFLSIGIIRKGSKSFNYALNTASGMGHRDIVELLLSSGKIVKGSEVFSSAIKDASEKGHRDIVELLVSAGAKVDDKTYSKLESAEAKQKLIQEAMQLTDQDMVDKLIETANYYASGGLSNENPSQSNSVKVIGQALNSRGGIREMRRIYNMIPSIQGKRTVEMEWNGIGEWRG